MAKDLYIIGLHGITRPQGTDRVYHHVSSHVRGGTPCDCDRPIRLMTKTTATLAGNCLLVAVE
ncbi:hypothetical protein JOJ86_005904 [Rhodococcus percolatus]|nr:hypothetical protein [Rhodococcus opacus]